MISRPQRTPEREAFYERMSVHSVAPLWQRLAGMLTAEPNTPAAAALWRYDEVRPFSFSDRVTQEKLGLWRERRGNE